MVLLSNTMMRLIKIIEFLIMVRIIFSFLNINGDNFITKFIHEMTEPILGPSRKLIYAIGIDTGIIDFSPILAIIILRTLYAVFEKLWFRKGNIW